jgi:hypothetical protein
MQSMSSFAYKRTHFIHLIHSPCFFQTVNIDENIHPLVWCYERMPATPLSPANDIAIYGQDQQAVEHYFKGSNIWHHVCWVIYKLEEYKYCGVCCRESILEIANERVSNRELAEEDVGDFIYNKVFIEQFCYTTQNKFELLDNGATCSTCHIQLIRSIYYEEDPPCQLGTSEAIHQEELQFVEWCTEDIEE